MKAVTAAGLTVLLLCMRSAMVLAGPVGLEAWLDQTPTVKEHLVWVTGDGKRLHFDEWTPAQKSRISMFYRKMIAGDRNLGMRLPDVDKTRGYFTAEVAFDLYAAHAAHVIYLEAKHLVPWSVQALPKGELDQLLVSSSYVARIKPSTRKLLPEIEANRDFCETPENEGMHEMTSDPRIGFEFISGKTSATHKNLIAANELDTLRNLTAWMRDNLDHGPLTDGKKPERAKVLRWLDDRLRALPPGHVAIANEGCHSASKLMVDLARSVNIPLLHTRALDPGTGEEAKHFFTRTHGGVVYGWGTPKMRVLWHTDNVYACEGKICFPIDDRTGELLMAEQADQRYFDVLWVSPKTLADSWFVFHLEKVFPDRGYGHDSEGPREQYWDYGMMSGYFKVKGKSTPDHFYDAVLDYKLCGEPLLHLWANHVVKAQMEVQIDGWRGDFSKDEVPLLHTLDEYDARAAVGVKAVGGAAKLKELAKQRKERRGNNLLAEGVTYPHPESSR